jgi:uncharacterized membrane protein YwaF
VVDPYSPSHLVALAVLVAGLPVAVLLGRRERRPGNRRLSRAFAVAIPLVFVPTQVVELATRWDLQVSVPLHLCDLAWLAATAALSLALAFVPRRKSLVQVAALSAALLIALQLTMQHWFYLYVVWFFPLALVALAAVRPAAEEPAPSPARRSRPAPAG